MENDERKTERAITKWKKGKESDTVEGKTHKATHRFLCSVAGYTNTFRIAQTWKLDEPCKPKKLSDGQQTGRHTHTHTLKHAAHL